MISIECREAYLLLEFVFNFLIIINFVYNLEAEVRDAVFNYNETYLPFVPG
jgi:hypothetical protein